MALTREQRRTLARVVLHQVGHIAEFGAELDPDLAGMDNDDVRIALQSWTKHLPTGGVYDLRIGDPWADR